MILWLSLQSFWTYYSLLGRYGRFAIFGPWLFQCVVCVVLVRVLRRVRGGVS